MNSTMGVAENGGILRGISAKWAQTSRQGQWLWWIVIVAAVCLLPVLNPPIVTTEPSNNFAITCFQMASHALVAVGLNIVVGYAGLLDLGYIAFFAVGAYTAALLTSPESAVLSLPYLWTIPIAMGVAMGVGALLGFPTLRLRGDYLAIVTLGLGEIVRILATIIPAMRGQKGFQGVGHPPGLDHNGIPIFSNANGTPWYWLTIACILVVLLLLGNLERSRVGRAWGAIREDEDAAESMGVPTFRYKIWAFTLGAAVGGLAGVIFAGATGFVNNQKFDVQTSVLFLVAVVVGGAGNKAGAILGGAIVAYIPLRFTGIADYKYLIFGCVLVVLMIWRSRGLLPPRYDMLAFDRRRGSSRRGKQAPDGQLAIAKEENDSTNVDQSTAVQTLQRSTPQAVAGIRGEDALRHKASLQEVLLEVRKVTKSFGGVRAVRDVSFDVRPGEIVGLIGPNGAGKTTCFHLLTGLHAPDSGSVRLDGVSLLGQPRYKIVRAGIGRTFQEIRIFREMTVLENVAVGMDAHNSTGVLSALCRLPRHWTQESAVVQRAEELLHFVGLGHEASHAAKNLSYGSQRRLEIARALATEPQLLCLDEPAAGFNPAEKAELVDLIRSIRDRGPAVLIIEHDMSVIMEVSDRVIVLNFGEKIADGPPSSVQHDPDVIRAYLGA